ncbi:MAG: cob(I)yrinic acid a,c-diamide adenosyltransferase [Candidatus Thermoplasmatota archaeon]|nr:cob(I)yrinic acid a,c-diamide adenosyltransferase [Candidatus Thermoplasmatota archaeon]
MQGYVYVYSGKGYGRTLVAIGHGLRCAGSGLKVYMIRFVDGNIYSELNAVINIPNFEIARFGRENFRGKETLQEIDFKLARQGLEHAKETISSGKYDVVILDEITTAIDFKLIALEEILKLINSRESTELVLTGRFSVPQIVKIADFAVELIDMKHPCDRELLAKVGIDYHRYMKNLGYSDDEIVSIEEQERDVK